METTKKVMLVAIDEGEHSLGALEWTLDHLFRATIFKIIFVHVRPSAFSTLRMDARRKEFFPDVRRRSFWTAEYAIDKARRLCHERSIYELQREVTEGDPKSYLCAAVRKYDASILVMGGHNASRSNNSGSLGSVADYCSRQANCNVIIVKKPTPKPSPELTLGSQNSRKTPRSRVMKATKKVMLVAIDEGELSFYALEWALDYLYKATIFELIVVHVRPPPAVSSLQLDQPPRVENEKSLPDVDREFLWRAVLVVEGARQLCFDKSFPRGVKFETMRGDPKDVLCAAVRNYHASILVVGNRSASGTKNRPLGSVADFCARQADCNVVIVKKPTANFERTVAYRIYEKLCRPFLFPQHSRY